MEDHLAIQLLPMRAAAAASSALGTLALAFSGAALYALVAWFVVMRRREIGVRMALGATAGDVRRLVLRQAAVTVAPGVVVGVLLAIAVASSARALLYGVASVDLAAVGVGLAAAVVAVAIGSDVPSRRAAGLDPVAALRD
jgi:ABC-type antimicrobial peptide transport system permease subunit